MATPSTPEASGCPLCSGTGWKPAYAETSLGSARDGSAGGPRGVVRCECMLEASVERRFEAARIPPRYQQCEFSNFQTNVHDNAAYNASLREARFLAERFAQEYPAQKEFGLLFMGSCGAGKTHLGVAILRALIEKGVDCLFCDFRELLKSIQSSYNPVSQATEMEILTPVLETEVLLLDDLGASKPSLWVLDTVAHILNSRYNEKRVTLLTTNYLDVSATREAGSSVAREDTLADRIGERIRSRLYEMCRVVPLQAEDFRRRVKQAQYHFS